MKNLGKGLGSCLELTQWEKSATKRRKERNEVSQSVLLRPCRSFSLYVIYCEKWREKNEGNIRIKWPWICEWIKCIKIEALWEKNIYFCVLVPNVEKRQLKAREINVKNQWNVRKHPLNLLNKHFWRHSHSYGWLKITIETFFL